MKKSDLVLLIRELLEEISVTGTGASFTPGSGAQYATPFSFSKGGKNRATKFNEKIGYKIVTRPKRPSSTKLIDYLQ